MRLGTLFYHNGQWDDAWKAFKNAGKATPRRIRRFIIGWRAWPKKKRIGREAAADAGKAYTAFCKDPQFLPLAAYYLTLDRQLEKAVSFLEKAKESDPNNANVLLFLGMNYLDLGKADKAREASG